MGVGTAHHRTGGPTLSVAAALISTLFVAAAVWCWPGPDWALRRVAGQQPAARPVRASDARDDPFGVAASLDLFAVCLRAGLPVGAAAAVVADSAPPGLARPLSVSAELLALGADADHAWRRSRPVPGTDTTKGAPGPGETTSEHFDAVATLARRSARAGSSLAGGLTELADGVRRDAHDQATAATERAGVAISAPLGLCFLPAFVCLGIVPVVLGLAGSVLGG
ncbi:type II secretion system F family protein [Gordonia sp. Z-3]|uniref:type II secretion system F family protein n=1 Tax=unclassified Gordonia (in: high G+C Gram-positive bacteria) TaxID=2657482 RepID=UPI000C6BF20A|nr:MULTISPECIES: type II secretion system F family protein [unclassified Gordonia (in: high G+C Gram-positive bacteria)]MAU83887.1 type II secretion system protein F [Gordonia sp. (in: high G+C Gram-positive bacteria)]MED5802988.1 type II secretion system F family protein [Gordonia sp. Z-3]